MSNVNETYAISNTSNGHSVSRPISSNRFGNNFNSDSYEYPLYPDYPTKVQEPVPSVPDSNRYLPASNLDLFDCPSYSDTRFAQPLQPLSQSEFELFEDTEPKLYQELNPINKRQSEQEDVKTYQDLDSPGGSSMQAGNTNDKSHYTNSKLYQQLQQPSARPHLNRSESDVRGQMPITTQRFKNNQNNLYNRHTHSERPLRLPSQPYVANNQYSSKLEISLPQGDHPTKNKQNEYSSQDNYSMVIKQNFQSLAKSANLLSLPTSPVCYGDLGASIRSKFQQKFQNICEVVPENKQIPQHAPPTTDHRTKQMYYPHDNNPLPKEHYGPQNSNDGISFTFNERTGNYNLTSKFSGNHEGSSYNKTSNSFQQRTSSNPVPNGRFVQDRLPSQLPFQYIPVPSPSLSNEPLTWEFNHKTQKYTQKDDENINKQEGASISVQSTNNQIWKGTQTKKHIIRSKLNNKISKLGNLSEKVLIIKNNTSTIVRDEATKQLSALSGAKPGKRKYVRSGKYVGRYKEYYMKQKHSITGTLGDNLDRKEITKESANESIEIKVHEISSMSDQNPLTSENKPKQRTLPNSEENIKGKVMIKNDEINVRKKRGRPKKCNQIPKESSVMNSDKSCGMKKCMDGKIPAEGLKIKLKRKRGRPRKIDTLKSNTVEAGNKSCKRKAKEDNRIPLRKYPRRKLKPKKFDSDVELDETDEDTSRGYKPRKYRKRRLDKPNPSYRHETTLKTVSQHTKILMHVDPLKEGLISDGDDDVFYGFDITADKNETESGLNPFPGKEEVDGGNNRETSPKVEMQLADINNVEEIDKVKHIGTANVDLIENTPEIEQNEDNDELKKDKPKIDLLDSCSSRNLHYQLKKDEPEIVLKDSISGNLNYQLKKDKSKIELLDSCNSGNLLNQMKKNEPEIVLKDSCNSGNLHDQVKKDEPEIVLKDSCYSGNLHDQVKKDEPEIVLKDSCYSGNLHDQMKKDEPEIVLKDSCYSGNLHFQGKKDEPEISLKDSCNSGNLHYQLKKDEPSMVVKENCNSGNLLNQLKKDEPEIVLKASCNSGNLLNQLKKDETKISLKDSCDSRNLLNSVDKSCLDGDRMSTQVSYSHTCSKCQCNFKSPDLLEKHFKWAHKRFSCSTCSETFTSYYFMRKHIEKEHQKNNANIDKGQGSVTEQPHVTELGDKCSLTFDAAEALKLLKAHEPLDVSPNNVAKVIDQKTNYVPYLEKDIMQFSCDLCSSAFLSKKALRMHIYKGHKVESKFVQKDVTLQPQDYEDLKISNQDEEEDSVISNHQADPQMSFSCRDCTSAFSTNRALRMHKFKAHKKNIYRCGKCLKRFEQLNLLTAHKRTCVSEDGPKFPCAYCSETFTSKDLLHEHWSVHLHEKALKCDYCELEFTTTNALKKHRLLHTCERIFRCEICQCSFPTLDILKDHIKAHTEALMYDCNICDKSFDSEKTLNAHKKVHLFKCNECSKSFKWKHALKSHKMSQHADQFYICEKCGKRLSDLEAFEKHSSVHTNELNCHLCFKSFSKPETLKTHMLNHSGAKLLKCEVCNKVFRHKVHLNVHLKSHQKDKLWPCKFCDKLFKSQNHLQRHKRVVHCRAFYKNSLSHQTLQDCNEIAIDDNKESESERQESISLGYNSQSDESGETSPGHTMAYLAEETSSAHVSGLDV